MGVSGRFFFGVEGYDRMYLHLHIWYGCGLSYVGLLVLQSVK